jgi:hypothetical protein
VTNIIADLINNLIFIFERMDWLSVVDISLVTVVFFSILRLLRDTQALVLLRGVFLLIALIGLLTSLEVLPAFSWLTRTTLPALLFAVWNAWGGLVPSWTATGLPLTRFPRCRRPSMRFAAPYRACPTAITALLSSSSAWMVCRNTSVLA